MMALPNSDGGSTRLVKQLKMLESGSVVAREQIGRILGSVVKTNPDQLGHLLERISPLFSALEWDTRIAASFAVRCMFAKVETVYGKVVVHSLERLRPA